MTTKEQIQSVINTFKNGDLTQCTLSLFETLGYNTKRRASFHQKTSRYFIENYGHTKFSSDRALTKEWKSINILFQLTSEEMATTDALFKTEKFEKQIIESYLFIAVDLSQADYSRTKLAQITREINKVFMMPVFLVFRYGKEEKRKITFSIINRRINKQDQTRDVLEKVTLIKDISIENTHRAHLDILYELSLDQIRQKESVNNFIELNQAWMKVLDIQTLNKGFYKQLVDWYAKCYADIQIDLTVASRILNKKIDEELKPQAVIRVIIRMMFLWFMKEKKIIPENLFTRKFADEFLKQKDSYYNAVLQNLFFAVLNKKINERRFRKMDTKNKYSPDTNDYGLTDVLRYEKFFKPDKANEFLKLTKTIPFVNGGLFTCHDYKFSGKDSQTNEKNIKHNYTIDGFSDSKKDRATISDDTIFKLFDLFNAYVFTLEESTPLEQDIALDPELLGTVFENLIGSYNPETKESARKATGSFYTPREIVDYMCKESLKAALQTKFPNLTKEIENLIDKNEEQLNFPNKNKIIAAITDLKILDPACGSGAFPMGMFSLMVRTIEKLQEQKTTYKNKLDIITNCIYGVDIQNIAVEISKLRFFISLLVDIPQCNRIENFEVLPNLETKLVVANSLIGIDLKKDESSLFDFNAEFRELTEIFLPFTTAKTPSDKTRIKNAFEKKKHEILNDPNSQLDNDTKNKIEKWNPFNVCYCSPFFDSNIMFGISEGFDIVIGNPPYVDSENMKKNQPEIREQINKSFMSTRGNWDLCIPFHEKAINLLKSNGIKSFISPNKWLSIAYASEFRKHYFSFLYKICKCDNIKVFDAGVSPVISFFTKSTRNVIFIDDITSDYKFESKNKLNRYDIDNNSLGILLSQHLQILIKIKSIEGRFRDWIKCENPFSTAEAYKLCEILFDNKEDNTNSFKLINTGTIDPYTSLYGTKTTSYLKGKYQFPKSKKSDIENYFPKRIAQIQSPKLIITGMRYLECYFDKRGEYIAGKSTLIIRDIKDNLFEFFCALLNSKLISFYVKQSFSSLGIDGGINFTKDIIDDIPIPNIPPIVQRPLVSLAKYVLFLRNSNLPVSDMVSNEMISSMIEKVIDACVYELYFEEEIKASNTNILSLLQETLSKINPLPVEQQIKQFYAELSEYKNEIRNRIILQETRSKSVSTIIKATEI
jgi:hypothetical protein